MSVEYISQLAEDHNNSCDSDYEFVNNDDNSDCESRGYQKIHGTKIPWESTGKTDSNTTFESSETRKLKLPLLRNKISLGANTVNKSNSNKNYSAEEEDKVAKIRPLPCFTIVPIDLNDGKKRPHETKVSFPEIVLTSFEVGRRNKNALRPNDKIEALDLANSGSLDIPTTSSAPVQNTESGSARIYPKTVIGQYNTQSPSPESFVDTQLSAASSLSNPSDESYGDTPNFDRKAINSTEIGESISHNEAGFDSLRRKPVDQRQQVFSKELQCGICQRTYRDPRTLCCLHSFCFQCLLSDTLNEGFNDPYWFKVDKNEYETKSVSRSKSMIKSTSDSSSHNRNTRLNRSRSRSPFSSLRNGKPFKNRKKEENLKNSSNLIICKECQHPTHVPIGGIRWLPQNLILIRKIEAFASKANHEVNSKLLCDLCCDESNAAYRCSTCLMNLCLFCKEAHVRQRPTASHKVEQVPEFLTSPRPMKLGDRTTALLVKCAIHTKLELTSFCISCLQVACSDCLVLYHKGHKQDSIKSAFRNYKKVIKDATDRVKPIRDYLQHSAAGLNEVTTKIHKKCDNTQKEVEDFIEAYQIALDLHKQTLIDQINRYKESKINAASGQHFELEKRSKEVMTAIQFSEELFKNGCEVEILSFLNILLERFDCCQKLRVPMISKLSENLRFIPEVQAPNFQNPKNIPLFGVIATQSVEPALCELKTEGYTSLRVHRKVEMIVISKDTSGMPLCHGGLKLNTQLKYKESPLKYIPVEVVDRRNGTYCITFKPDFQGTIILTVTINEKHVQGSPYIFTARVVLPHSGVFHCCTFCSSNGSKQATCACDSQMPGYKGCGHGHNGHPGKRHWSCCGNIQRNSECSAENKRVKP